ncbi:Fur family transcriptional regulator [Leptolyngbya sp. FACHB-261]|uniref:Fur family transcriptional regulator n=1 Tax=Leptolyngbya sp. FACHB-261 TaxID=2692806 RepID=UPI00168A139B|nr:transcriptional repressor [Leptolyngbya sp. FACHB-261]MBD2099342.1 transcriptional repressor [Leptolyngbya sp. FACHB-261]
MKLLDYTASALKEELHRVGFRMTNQRREILDFFLNLPEGEHLSAQEVHQRTAAQGSRASLSTVYRCLKLMARLGLLRELEFPNKEHYYELNREFCLNAVPGDLLQEDETAEQLVPAPHHHHLVCVRTNRIQEFHNDQVCKTARKIAEKYGFKVLDCQFTIIGVSPEGQLLPQLT